MKFQDYNNSVAKLEVGTVVSFYNVVVETQNPDETLLIFSDKSSLVLENENCGTSVNTEVKINWNHSVFQR